MPKPCPTCFFEVQENGTCSEFCSTTTHETHLKLKGLKQGDWGLWPCPKCGATLEGIYNLGLRCPKCEASESLRRRTALLHETEKELQHILNKVQDLYRFSNPGSELEEAIDAALGKDLNKDGYSKTYLLRETIKDELGLVPSTLAEAMTLLDDMLSSEDREALQQSENVEDLIGRLHHSLGRYLRNEWRLWHNSPLAKHLKEQGVTHPDDMSHFILQCYARDRIKTWHERLVTDAVVQIPLTKEH